MFSSLVQSCYSKKERDATHTHRSVSLQEDALSCEASGFEGWLWGGDQRTSAMGHETQDQPKRLDKG